MIGFFINSIVFFMMRAFLEPAAVASPELILDFISSSFFRLWLGKVNVVWLLSDACEIYEEKCLGEFRPVEFLEFRLELIMELLF